MTRRAGPLLVLLLASAPLAGRAWAGSFTFQGAEFLDEDQARASAAAWTQANLPPGLPVTVARARARAAGMVCGAAHPGSGRVRCRYSMVVHKPGGVIGEDNFTLALTPDAAGRLVGARLAYMRDGVPD